MSIEELINIVKPPVTPLQPGTAQLWDETQTSIGTVLPDDYKQYISLFGSGGFHRGDWTFLYPYSPFATRENFMITIDRVLWVYRECQESTPDLCPFRTFPETNGLLPWGRTDNGDALFWLMTGASDDWPTVIFDSKYDEYETYSISMTSFLAQWLSGVIKPAFFPDLPPHEMIFKSEAL